MLSKWILFFVFAITSTRAQCQLNQEMNLPVHWKGLGFIKGAGNLNRLTANACGIYSAPDDRKSGILSLAIDCRSEAHSIKSGFVRDKSAIRIVRDEETLSYLKRDLYGYRDCKGNEYHFFDGKSYQLLNPGESVPIYRVFEWRGKQRVAKHFFKGESTGTVKSLTLENLRDEFSGEPRFLERLSLLAENNFQLVKYLYAINRAREDAL